MNDGVYQQIVSHNLNLIGMTESSKKGMKNNFIPFGQCIQQVVLFSAPNQNYPVNSIPAIQGY